MVQGPKAKFVSCSRWSELTESLRFHAGLAEAASAPTEFRLLNGAPPVVIGVGDGGLGYRKVLSMLEVSPGGGTPLCKHITEVIQQISALEPQLRANGQRAVIILCTDGESSDGDVVRAMVPLQNLPVWVVVRLCTDDERVCHYWNNIDKQLEVEMDVLDDFQSEAVEVNKVNPWVTYCEPVHRIREFGIRMKEMDLLDETKLSTDQMRAMVATLTIGGPPSEVPHPEVDWSRFLTFTNTVTQNQPTVYCPIECKQKRYLKTKVLAREYHAKAGCICS